MKLSLDILCDYLSLFMNVKRIGKDTNLPLKRPEFCIENTRFLAGHIYLARSNSLPSKPIIEAGSVIIAIGGKPDNDYANHGSILIPQENEDILTIFNLIQNLFNIYDDWSEQVQQIVETTSDLNEILRVSLPVLNNSMAIIDSGLRILAYAEPDDIALGMKKHFTNIDGGMVSVHYTEEFQKLMELSTAMTSPFFYSIDDMEYYCISIYVQNSHTVTYMLSSDTTPHSPGVFFAAQHLVSLLEKAINQYSHILSSYIVSLKDVFRDLLNSFPVDSSRINRAMGNAACSKNDRYFCLKFKTADVALKIPIDYYCTLIDNTFPGSLAFEYDSIIVSFINMEVYSQDIATFINILTEFLQDINFKVGISNIFTVNEISQSRYYYRQACSAFEIGCLYHPKRHYYFFKDYAFLYMLTNCTNDMPPNLLYPEGLSLLRMHDIKSQVNYVETLQLYLDNKMNATQTAKDMYIHRSTLLQRLDRIESILQMDLDDPNQRLHLQLSLMLMKMNETE